MTMHDLDPFTNNDISKHGEEGEDGRERCLAIDDEEWNVVDFESICEVPDTSATGVGMCNDNNLVSAIDEFLREREQLRTSLAVRYLH